MWEKIVPVPNIWATEVPSSWAGFSSCINITWRPDGCALISSISYITRVHSYDVTKLVNIAIYLFQGPRMPYIMKRSRSGWPIIINFYCEDCQRYKHLLFPITQEHLKRAKIICKNRLRIRNLMFTSRTSNNKRQDKWFCFYFRKISYSSRMHANFEHSMAERIFLNDLSSSGKYLMAYLQL